MLRNGFRLPPGALQAAIGEAWMGYLTLPDACCGECAQGNTADCDINILRRPLTRGDMALFLMREGQCP